MTIIFSLLLIITNLIILLKLRKEIPQKTEYEKEIVNISLLIPFRNEAKNLLPLIDSINKIDYPKKAFEVIFIDDNSSDNFLQIIENNLELKINYQIVSASKKKLDAKKGALAIGLESAQFNFIITTDADAVLPQNLFSAYSEKFKNGLDIVFGPSHLINNKTLAGRLSQFYNLRSQILIFTASKIGYPYSAMGSNIGYRKAKFLEIGGYEKFNEVISGDDDLLIRESIKRNYNIGTILSSEYLVKSNAVKTVREFLNQKARHTATSNYYLLKHQIGLSLWHLLNIVSLLSPILIFLDKLFLIPFLLKLFFDLFVIKSKEKLFGYRFNFLEIIFYQICYEVLLIINYLNASLKRYSWK